MYSFKCPVTPSEPSRGPTLTSGHGRLLNQISVHFLYFKSIGLSRTGLWSNGSLGLLNYGSSPCSIYCLLPPPLHLHLPKILPSQSWSSHHPSSRVYSQLLSHGRLTNYTSHPFQSFIFTNCNNIRIFVHFLKFPTCSYYPHSFFYHRSVNTLTTFLSHVFSL